MRRWDRDAFLGRSHNEVLQHGYSKTYIGASRALKLKDAANYLSVSPISVRRLIQRGLIKPNRALRHILIPIGELDRFLENGAK